MQQWKQVAGAGALVALTVLPVSTTLCAVWCAPAAGSTTTGIVTGSSAAHHGSGTATREASDHRRLPVGARSGNDCGETHEAAREAPALPALPALPSASSCRSNSPCFQGRRRRSAT